MFFLVNVILQKWFRSVFTTVIAMLLSISMPGCQIGPIEELSPLGLETPVSDKNSNQTATSTTSLESSSTDHSYEKSYNLPPISQVANNVAPAVVSITTERMTLDFFFREQVVPGGQGSGVIFDQKGLIITNNHVIENSTNVQVTLLDGRVFEGIIIGSDPPTDLAVIKIDASNVPIARLGTTAKTIVGDWVVAIGNALGDGISVTQGIVSAMEREATVPGSCQIENVIQTDAAINPGNSGGPLLNLEGEVIGINTAIARNAEGIGYAISIDEAYPIVNQLVERGRVLGEPWIGIRVGEVSAAVAQQFQLNTNEGLIVSPIKDSPAWKAGIKIGDVITYVNNKKIKTSIDLDAMLSSSKVNQEIKIKTDRFGEILEFELKLGEKPRLCE